MRRLAFPAVLLLLLGGCGSQSGGGGEGGVGVVATTTHVADLVDEVGGPRVDLHAILQPDADPHGYEPRPSDAAAIAKSSVVFRSGGDVDEWLGDLVESSGADTEPVDLVEFTRPGADPHWWQDPRRAILAVEAIRASLTAADPAGRAGYARRARAYTAKLRRLDREIARCMARIPAGQRKLVTAHDSLGYLAARYDIEVIGSVIPSLSTQAQPSAKEVDELVGQIEDEGVNAVFPEAAVSEDLEQAIAREAGAQVGGELWTDSLGGSGSGAETYLDAMRANAQTLAQGMSRGRVSCVR